MKLHGQARGIPNTVAPESAPVERNPAPEDQSSTGKPVVFWGVDKRTHRPIPLDTAGFSARQRGDVISRTRWGIDTKRGGR